MDDTRASPFKPPRPLLCPCCKQPVTVPLPDTVAASLGLTEMETAILKTAWSGRGLPVPSERFFSAIYINDPNGGPSTRKAYLNFQRSLFDLRRKLEGSGLSILNAGYRCGYRLVIEAQFPQSAEA